MSTTAIQIEDLSKRYRIGERESYRMLRDALTQAAKAPFQVFAARRKRSSPVEEQKDRPEYVWALKDVSCEIAQGEIVGIVGRNGAGKSTLLKILSRITPPTVGRAIIRGRIGSLLEVGTGFHPELTGRENIYLSGAVLGMRRGEIARKFDEIVHFAEVESFIDTPVKRYSSGMYLRLAFAVAAHLETEILLVDEVLAVGDAAFQQKCLRAMGQLSHAGRTVLFVSHQLAAIEALCTSCLLLDHGRLVARGTPGAVIGQYLETTIPAPSQSVDLREHPGRLPGLTPMMQTIRLCFRAADKSESSILDVGGDLTLTVAYQTSYPIARPVLGFRIKNRLGANILSLNNRFFDAFPSHRPSTTGAITCQLNNLLLVEGRYTIDLWFGDHYEDHDIIEDAISFDIVFPHLIFNARFASNDDLGILVWPTKWSFEAYL